MNRIVFEEKQLGIDENWCLAIKNIDTFLFFLFLVGLVTIRFVSAEYISEVYIFLSSVEFLLNRTRELDIFLKFTSISLEYNL